MADDPDIPHSAPAGGGGPGGFRSAASTGLNPVIDKWNSPGPQGGRKILIAQASGTAAKLNISGIVVAGAPLSAATVAAVNAAAAKVPSQWRRYIAYEDKVKVGGSLAWRANNPGNLRDASTKIGSVAGAVGHFAVFATLDAGRAAQRDLYLTKYGTMTVRKAVDKLTPPSENDTATYLANLKKAGVDLDKNISSQIDKLMTAIEANEGLIEGTEVPRVP